MTRAPCGAPSSLLDRPPYHRRLLAEALRAGHEAGVFELRIPAGDVAGFLIALADGVTIRRLSEPALDVRPLMDQAVAAARALLA